MSLVLINHNVLKKILRYIDIRSEEKIHTLNTINDTPFNPQCLFV